MCCNLLLCFLQALNASLSTLPITPTPEQLYAVLQYHFCPAPGGNVKGLLVRPRACRHLGRQVQVQPMPYMYIHMCLQHCLCHMQLGSTVIGISPRQNKQGKRNHLQHLLFKTVDGC
jgi:hypothetical protein